MLIMPGHYGKPKKPKAPKAPKTPQRPAPTGQLKMNMKKMPPAVQKRLMAAMKRKKQGMR